MASERGSWEMELTNLESLIMDKSESQKLSAALKKLMAKWKPSLYREEAEGNEIPTLLGLAIQYQNLEGLIVLMEGFGLHELPDKSSTPDENTDPYCLAVVYYEESVFKYVMNHIEVVKAFRLLQPAQRSVLHVAAQAGTTNIFRILHKDQGEAIESNILHVRDSQQQTALHVAVSMKHEETVAELLRIQPELIKAQDASGETVFHKAVATNRNILERLLASNAEVLSQCDNKGNSAYRQFLEGKSKQRTGNRGDQEVDQVQRTKSFDDSVGSILGQAILTLENLSVVDKRRLLFKDALGPDIQCDLSLFTADNLDLAEYLYDLEQNHLNIEYYETLIRVKLPDLSCSPKRVCAVTFPNPLRKNPEANLVFDYLSRRGVKRVIEAVIPDCIIHPHSNRDIINALKPMGIKRLNWRKLNLGISTIKMAAPEVEDLTLYSSGDEDVLLQWAGARGFFRLRELKRIHIIIFKGEDTDNILEAVRERIEGRLKVMEKYEFRVTFADMVGADKRGNDTTPSLVHRHLGQTNILEHLSPFQALLERHYPLPSEPRMPKDELIKVAILDSGVYANRLIFPNLTGSSFVEDTATADSHWHTVTNSHGTQMASLISGVNPYCHIYAARTHFGAEMHGGNVYSVNKALDWATNHNVDIICISWTCHEELSSDEHMDLEAKISEAGAKCLIFCATGDKGPAAREPLPAGFAEPFSISNCSIVGNHLDQTEIKHTEFLLPALNLSAKVPKYIKRDGEDTVEGSSAATAVAVGLASLVLSLVWFASSQLEQVSERERQITRFKRRSTMARVFQHMCGSTTNFVQPWKFLPRNLDEMRLDQAKKAVQEFLNEAAKVVR